MIWPFKKAAERRERDRRIFQMARAQQRMKAVVVHHFRLESWNWEAPDRIVIVSREQVPQGHFIRFKWGGLEISGEVVSIRRDTDEWKGAWFYYLSSIHRETAQ